MDIQKGKDSYEMHFEFQNQDCHIMNAEIELESSQLFVKAVNYISSSLHVSLNTTTTSLKQGSVVRYFRIVVAEKDENGWLLYIVMILLKYSLFDTNTDGLRSFLESLTDGEMEQLKKVLGQKNINETRLKSIPSDYAVLRRRSSFYERLYSDDTIKSITINLGRDYSFDDGKGKTILRKDFEKYVVKLEPEEITINDAIVYIVSPVLVKGLKNKWKGIFERECISFNLDSNEFRVKVQSGDIDFRSGSNMICTLKYTKTIDEEGKEHKSNYRVTLVSKYGVDEKYEETLEGKKKRIEEAQPSLFDDFDF